MISGLPQGFDACCLHERCCRRPCKARFRLAGCAFAGRALNPLDRIEKFQNLMFVLLSRAYLDASWAHVRLKFHDVFAANGSPIAKEALDRIAALYAIEAEIRGRVADERRAVRQMRAGPRSMICGAGSTPPCQNSPPNPIWPPPSAMLARAGQRCADTATMAASRSTTMPPRTIC